MTPTNRPQPVHSRPSPDAEGDFTPTASPALGSRLIVTVDAVRGTCPVYHVGDRLVIDDGFRLNLSQTDAVCMHALASILPYYVALSRGVSPAAIGLANERGLACVQCLDPCRRTGGGTVTFEIHREEVDS